MRRVVGIPMSLPGALHTVASQHISTLHNASGTHILRYAPAQVKHHLFATSFFGPRATRFVGRDVSNPTDAHDARMRCRRVFLAFWRVAYSATAPR
jgi:hypothetical protein